MQNQIDRYRKEGDNYSVNMRQQIHKMRQEKAAWLAEAQDLRNKDAENKVRISSTEPNQHVSPID